MWNLSATPPLVVQARVLTRMPDSHRRRVRTDWSDANKGGHEVDCFLEGPTFDRDGNLYVVDIPFGRIFRISPALEWTVVAKYDGWPNGLALHRDGSLWIADYRRGLMRLEAAALAGGGSGAPVPMLGHRNSEAFRGLNDLTFDMQGRLYFTDQGQTGLHDPTGRVYRYDPARGSLELMVGGVPSPNGVALDTSGKVLFIAVTRANQVWRGPILADGTVSKVGAFRTFFGPSGPDGMAVDAENRLVVAHASMGGAFVVNAIGEVTHFVKSPGGATVTNVAFRPGTAKLVMTESETGTILEADLPGVGAGLFSHA
jgi:gluconolactonase